MSAVIAGMEKEANRGGYNLIVSQSQESVKKEITNISTMIDDFTLPVRTNDTAYGKDTNETYWMIEVPLSVGGYCNGTIVFTASAT